jgi:predicted nucleic acid-binding protein
VTVEFYLADKSALEHRRSEAARGLLDALLDERAIATCEVVALEVLYSARNRRDYDRRWSVLMEQPWLPMDQAVMRRALEVQRLLARKGQHRLPIADLLVAATAEVHGATVLHYDRDFDRIAEVTGQPTRWIVAPPAA